MGFFDDDSIVGFDANSDGRIDVFDDIYMRNMAATGDGYLSEEDAMRMEDEEELDISLMDASEIREAIEMGELDPEEVDWDDVDMTEFASLYTSHSSGARVHSSNVVSNSSLCSNTVNRPAQSSNSYSKQNGYSSYNPSSEVSSVEAILYVVLGLILQCVFYVLFDIEVKDVPTIVIVILWIVFSFISFAIGQMLKK